MKLGLLWFGGLASLLVVGSTTSGAEPAARRDRMVVHEWGTFTALQAEDGRAIAGINTDDEPLPSFVHELHRMLVGGPTEVPAVYFKGAPRVHPDVIVRLETPVIYFYPPTDGPAETTVDVDVSFRGGWLTQYYPDAKAAAPGLDGGRSDMGSVDGKTVGTLSWHNLKVGGSAPGPQTDSPVWLAPRKVAAASVRAEGGEAERYLFYRGVGHINAPLQVTRDTAGGRLLVRSQAGSDLKLQSDFAGTPLWLVDVREDGSVAFVARDKADLTGGRGEGVASLPSGFTDKDYGPDNLQKIWQSLHAALVKDGLYADEADALLATWKSSYFRRPGLRLFFLVPRPWTDAVLPLRVSGSADMTRVLVGRIEIVTPRQRELLGTVARGPTSDPKWVHDALRQAGAGREDYYREVWYQQVMSGEMSLTSLNVKIPADYRAYLSLGRFRNALILDEQRRRPSPALEGFINAYQLQASHERENRP